MFEITPPHIVKGRFSAVCIFVGILEVIDNALGGA